ncbi:MAG: hypothetical protein AB9891_06270 [Anaerolineaceae bacterium]
MKNKLIFFVLLAIMVVICIGCAPGIGVQVNTPVPAKQSGTPTPDGQIDVPGFNIQLNPPGANPLANTANTSGRIATLLTGVWHGFISPVTLLVSLTNSNVQMYEVHNDGSQYNSGFLLGIAIVFLFLGIILGRRR